MIYSGYKITNRNMTCRGYHFELGKEHVHSGPVKICQSGFHFCENPIHCFAYYSNPLGDKRLFKIVSRGKHDKRPGGDKVTGSKIEFIEEITDIPKFLHEYLKERLESSHGDDYLYKMAPSIVDLVNVQFLLPETRDLLEEAITRSDYVSYSLANLRDRLHFIRSKGIVGFGSRSMEYIYGMRPHL